MAAKKKPKIEEKDLEGLKYFKALGSIFERLHDVGIERDRAGNRKLYFDHYAGLLLVYFYNPIVTSLRGIQQTTELKKVQRIVGCSRASLGSLSEAAQVFDSARLEEIVAELSAEVPASAAGVRPEALEGLTAVDGTLLPALPKMAWALWLDEKQRAAKMHLVFEVARWAPLKATLTEGNGSENNELRGMLEPGRLYVMDRGYAEYALLQEIIARESSFICRVRDNAVWRLVEERQLTPEARAAGVLSDRVVWLGCAESGAALRQQLRLVEVATGKHDARGKAEVLLLATDRLELAAELVALGYRFRWSVEANQAHYTHRREILKFRADCADNPFTWSLGACPDGPEAPGPGSLDCREGYGTMFRECIGLPPHHERRGAGWGQGRAGTNCRRRDASACCSA